MKTAALVLTVLGVCVGPMSAQGTGHTLEGVWKVTEIVVTGTGAYIASQPQPSLFIFSRNHYSLMWIPGNLPRAVFKGAVPTTEEKLAAFDSFVGGAGTYDVVGQKLTFRPIVAKGSTCGAGVFIEEQFSIENNTLVLNWTSNSTKCPSRPSADLSTKPSSATRMTLVRIE